MMGNVTAQEADNTVIDKAEEPTEFVGTLKEETRQIGSYLLVKHTYTSDGLNLKNVDHIYREEIIPVNANMTQQEIDQMTDNPEITASHEMTIVHEDEISKIDKIQNGLDVISTEAYQQWSIVEASDESTTNPVTYYGSSLKPVATTPVEDWASKKNGKVYVSHDPINLIWKDTVSGSEKLVDKVHNTMIAGNWNEITDQCASEDLYINISGIWTKQYDNYLDRTGLLCDQYHVRTWEINDNLVLGSAHKEFLLYKLPWEKANLKHITSNSTTWEYDVPTRTVITHHFLTGFDTAEDEVAGEFSGGCWGVSKDSENLNNLYTRESYLGTTKKATASNDGFATEILCS